MGSVTNAEVMTVADDEIVVTFATEGDDEVTTTIGEHAITTVGPHHVVRITDLEPSTTYPLVVDGAAPTEWLPDSVTTLVRPAGRRLCTFATANDVHFGETEAGHVGGVPAEDLGPIFRAAPGEPPYPEVMNGAVIDEMRALDPDVVLVKGDLTNLGLAEEFEAFLDAYGTLGERMRYVRGNHDAMLDPDLATGDAAPYTVEFDGVTLAVLDTVVPGIDRGQIPASQIDWLDDLAATSTTPVLVFGHHHLWNLDASERSALYFGVNPDDSEAFAGVVARRPVIHGYFAGHTHRNRVRRFAATGAVPFVEVACTKDYPGAWAEYRVYEGGYTQVVRRATSRDALAWTEQTREMFAGLYHDYALGLLEWRCFTQMW